MQNAKVNLRWYSDCRRGFSARFAWLCLLWLIIGSGFPAITAAQGEHSRRAAAELRVLAGDLRRLVEETPTQSEVAGLAARINGNFVLIELLMRYADNEQRLPPGSYRDQITRIQTYWRNGDAEAALAALTPLLLKFKLQLPIVLSSLTSAQAEQAKSLHQSLCAVCHDKPATGSDRPAYNLFAEAKTLSADEFTARMMVGVKGDRVTGIDNPLSDIQLALMIRYYTATEFD